METLLISLKRQHCNNVFNGKKTIELRKRCPKSFTTMGQVFAEFTKIMIYEATIHQTATGIKILG
jgi:predicted transcriptional regulator